jgi:cytidylate kinase
MSDVVSDPKQVSPTVVTLFESYGSGAGVIGPRVAEALGVIYHEQAFSSEQLERNAELRENEGLLARVFSAMGTSSFGGLDVGDVSGGQRDNYDLVMQNTATVQQWARTGGVIVGRNGAYILADLPTALHVKLDGPLERRIARAAEDAGISPDRAARRQKNEDKVRADMSIELYGWDPRDPTRYDLVVNTGLLHLDTCVDVIVAACRAKLDHPSRRTS